MENFEEKEEKSHPNGNGKTHHNGNGKQKEVKDLANQNGKEIDSKQGFIPLIEEQKEQKQEQQILDDVRIKASPLADSKLTVKLLHLLKQSISYKQLKKGMNESLKALSKNICEVIIMAGDCDPLEILSNIPVLCQEKNVPYCFIESKAALGRACGIKRPVTVCAILEQESSQLNSQILEVKDAIEQLYL